MSSTSVWEPPSEGLLHNWEDYQAGFHLTALYKLGELQFCVTRMSALQLFPARGNAFIFSLCGTVNVKCKIYEVKCKASKGKCQKSEVKSEISRSMEISANLVCL